MRNAKRIPRADYDDPEMADKTYSESKAFEEKYLRAAKDRIYNGKAELKSPEEDETLKEMKLEYAKKKTEEMEAGNKYKC